MQNSVSKCEKAPWTQGRRWLFLLMLLLVTLGTLLFTRYTSITNPLGDLAFMRTSFGLSRPRVIGSATRAPDPASKLSASPYSLAYPHQYHFILDEPDRCRQESPFLVLMIPIAPSNREARDVIRSTWGRETTMMGQHFIHYFMLGQPTQGEETRLLQEQVLEESQQHHDILQSDFLDNYYNLTIKTMVMFEWLISHCPNTSYAMKVDSDVFLNVQKLVDMLLKAPRQLYMTGVVVRGAAVHRDANSKWFMPFSEYAESSYPPYVMGLGYVFSMDLPRRILEASSHVRAVYIEDVYVGLCLRHLGIQVSDPPNNGFRTTMYFTRGNCYWTSVITTELQDSEQLKHTWATYQTEAQNGC